MVIRRLVLSIAAALLLAGCGGAPAAVAPTAAPTAVPSCQETAAGFVAQIEPLAREWDDAVTLANSTPRVSLSGQIEKLQSIKRRAQDLQVPDCAAIVKQDLTSAMDSTIRGFIAFLGQQSESDVEVLFTLSKHQQSAFAENMRRLKAGETLPAAEPPLDGLGVSQATIRDLYEKEGFTLNDSSPVGGQPRLMGATADGLEIVELIGPADNARRAFRAATMRGGSQARIDAIKASLQSFLKQVAPDWTEGESWLAAAMDKKSQKETTVTRGRVVTYTHTVGSEDLYTLQVVIP